MRTARVKAAGGCLLHDVKKLCLLEEIDGSKN